MADDKYLQNRQLAYDLLKQEGYTDIGDSAEELFKDKSNSELAYQLLSDAGYTDIGKDYNEFAGMLYGPSRQQQQKEAVEGYDMFNARRSSAKPATSALPVSEPEPQPVPKTDKERLDDLYSQREGVDSDFIGEYEKRKSALEEQTKGLSNVKGDIRNLGIDTAQINSESAWLRDNEARYSEQKKEQARIEGGINEIVYNQKKDELAAARKANRENMASPQEIIARGIRPNGADNAGKNNKEFALRDKADEIYAMADQTYDQGSKYDKGYSGNELQKAWTAVSQFVSGAANNIDKGSLTAGLSEGTALKAARDAGEKYNEVITDTYKKLGYSEEDATNLVKSLEEDTQKLNGLAVELDAEQNDLIKMGATLEDMVRRGDPNAKSYEEEYNKRLAEYEKKYQDEYTPLLKDYKKYRSKYDALQGAIESAANLKLSDGERAVLDAFDKYTEAQMLRAEDVSVASKAGAGAEQSAEFMLDFILTGGLERGGAKLAAKLFSKNLAKKAPATFAQKLGKAAQVGLRDAGVAAARTSLMFPRNLAAYGEQLTELTSNGRGGKDELGRYDFNRTRANAALNTALTQYIEYWSEGFGNYFGAGERWVFENVTKKAPRTAIGKTLSQYRGSIGRYLDYGKFDGMFNEMMEEVVGSGLNALSGWMSGDRVGDKKAMEQFWGGENLSTLFFSFLPMSAISAGTNLRAYNKMKQRHDAGAEMVDQYVGDRKELDDLIANIDKKTPEQLTQAVVSITDKARKENGGQLPEDFAKNLMGFIEGEFSLNLRHDAWEQSQEKLAVVNAYALEYDSPDPSLAWGLTQNEQAARNAALEKGFTEEELDQDPYVLAQEANEIKEYDPERANTLMDYATAKGARNGLKDGYDNVTREMSRAQSEFIESNFDNNGNIIRATLADGTEVFITSKDAKVNRDGTISVSTPNGLVSYKDGYGNEGTPKKSSEFSGATSEATDYYIFEREDEFLKMREAAFAMADSPESPSGVSEQLAQRQGQTVFVTGNGAYEPVTILRMTDGGRKVVITGDKEALKGIATAAGIPSPGGTNLEIDAESLYQLLAREDDGSLTTQAPEGTAQEGTPEIKADELLGSEQKINLNGTPTDVFVEAVDGGNVTFEYEDANGNTKRRTVPADKFISMMQEGTELPTAEETAPVAEEAAPATEQATAESTEQAENVPEVGTIPVDKNGEKIYDAPGVSVEDAIEDIYTTPNLTEEMADTFIEEMAAEAEKGRNPKRGKMGLQAWIDATAEANRKADFWKAMMEYVNESKEARKQEEKAEAERQKLIKKYGVDTSNFDLTPQTMEEALADELAGFFRGGGLLNMDSVLNLIGKDKMPDMRKNGYAVKLSKKKNAIPVDIFVREVSDKYPGYIKDEQDAVNAVGDLLMTKTRSELRDLIFNNRLEEARRQQEAESAVVEEQTTEAPVEEPQTPVEEPAAPATEEEIEDLPEETVEETTEEIPEDLPEETVEEAPAEEAPAQEEEKPEEPAETTENNPEKPSESPEISVTSQEKENGVPATAADIKNVEQARAFFENKFGKGKRADNSVRVWELAHKTPKQEKKEADNGMSRMAMAVASVSGLSEEEAAELVTLGTQLAEDYINDGYVKFPQFFKNLVETFGDGIRPFAKSIYLGASANVSDEIADQMDDRKTVRTFDTEIDLNDISDEQSDTDIQPGDTAGSDVVGGVEEGGSGQAGNGDVDTGTAEENGGSGESSVGELDGGNDTGSDSGADEPGANGTRKRGRRSGTDDGGATRQGAGRNRGGRPRNSNRGEGVGLHPDVGEQSGVVESEAEKEAKATAAEQAAYEAEKERIKDETDTKKLKALLEELKDKLTGLTDVFDTARAKLSGQLRAIREKLQELFSNNADKSETLAQEKVPYSPVSDPTGEHSIGSVVPSGSADYMTDAVKRLEAEVGKTVAEYVREELGYKDLDEMFTSDGKDIGLSAEQVDAVGLAIHQMKTGRVFIVGDMTGVGKGRVGAALIRWGKRNKKKVIFCTEKPNLFSAMYGDLADIGYPGTLPFIINDNAKANITDEDDTVVIHHPTDNEYQSLYKSGKDTLPIAAKWGYKGRQYDFVMTTYSQLQASENEEEGDSEKVKKKNERNTKGRQRLDWLKNYAKDAIIIMDESHTAAGEGSTRGENAKKLVEVAQGVTFMSATFAKTPESMGLYAIRSSMNDAMITRDQLIAAISRYGIPMQEILAASLFKTGEMVRRERDFDGVKTNWMAPDESYSKEEIETTRGLSDKTVGVINDIIDFQRRNVDPVIRRLNENVRAQNEAALASGASDVYTIEYDSTPYSGQVSNVVGMMLFALKAKKAAEMAIEQIKKGEKPVIAVDNTLGAYVDQIEGNIDSADFGAVLMKGLAFALRYQKTTTHHKLVTLPNGLQMYKKVPADKQVESYDSIEGLLGAGGREAIEELEKEIVTYGKETLALDLPLSPIDYIKKKIADAGYRCGEITQRANELVQNEDGTWKKSPLKHEKTQRIVNQFNGGTVKRPLPKEETFDAIIMNRSGATGNSMHASRRYADQRPRKMIILQAAKDPNNEVQIRGRIDRTGQVARGEYFYIISPIPAEKKITMMLKQKLASLDATSVGSEKVASNRVEAEDMDNKYGDEVARDFLADHEEIHLQMDAAKQMKRDRKTGEWKGRPGLLYDLLLSMQRMTCTEQEMILSELEEAYMQKIEYLNQNGINDLATTTMNLEATTIDKAIMVKGKDNDSLSEFAHDTNIERVEVNVLRKPMRSEDIWKKVKELGGMEKHTTTNSQGETEEQSYGEYIQQMARDAAKNLREEKEKKLADAERKLEKDLKAQNPKPDTMTDVQYEIFIDNDPKMAALRLRNSNEAARYQAQLAEQLRFLRQATDGLKVGRAYLVPLNESQDAQNMYGRFLGFKTGKDGRPKSIEAVFATKDSRAMVSIPVVNMHGIIERIRSNSGGWYDLLGKSDSDYGSEENRLAEYDKWWDRMIPANTSRAIRYMITGNILQSAGNIAAYRGTITTFTRKDAETGEITVDKGLLLAEDFDPENFMVRTEITKDDVWNTPGEFKDDLTNIAVHRDGDRLVVKFTLPRGSRAKLSNHPIMSDDEFKALCEGGDIIPFGRDELRAVVSDENAAAALNHLYKTYGFTQGHLLVLPDSTEKPDRIVYSGKPYNEVIDELKPKYSAYGSNSAQSKIDDALKTYKMDVTNEDLKNKIRELVQLRQAYLRRDYALLDDASLAWNVISQMEEIEKLEKGEPNETPEQALDRKRRREGARNLMEAYKEELASRGYEKGHLKHFKQGKSDLDTIINTFNEFNSDKKNAEIMKKVLPIVKLLNVSPIFNEKIHNSTGGETAGNYLGYNWRFMNEDWIPDQLKANTILHEMIHTATAYAINAVNMGADHLIAGVVDAANQANALYSAINRNRAFRHQFGEDSWNTYTDYGAGYNSKEMLAETGANQSFRDDLEKVKVLVQNQTSFGQNVFSFTDVTSNPPASGNVISALDAAMDILNRMLDNFNSDGYQKMWAGTRYGEMSYREADTPAKRRIVDAEIEATNKTLDRMGEELGVKINKVGRDGMPKGHKTAKGYFNPKTGEMTICMDNVTDERDAIATVLHETVGHKGLRELFGPKFNEAMVNIYAALDNKGKQWVNGYITRHNLDFGSDGIIRGMEEYMAHLAESGNFMQSVWSKIKEILGKIVDMVFGTDGFVFTDRELNYILRASYEHLKNPNWLDTALGKAQDTLWKRELGINESDPNRPTDPEGPGTGILYRDGDTGVASEDYESSLDEWWVKPVTENQDAMTPVKIGVEKVMKEVGMEKLEDSEDYVTRQNHASSKSETDAHDFELFKFKPMLGKVREIRDALTGEKANADQRQEAYERTLDYIYAVSGLERNKYKNDEIEQDKKAALQGVTDPKKIATITAKYDAMKRDWSGIASLMGYKPADRKTKWHDAEKQAQEMVDKFEKEVGNKNLLNELWDGIRACTDYSLEHAYTHGLLTREEYEKLHGTASRPRMWEHYVPLRGFSEDTAEDKYDYSMFANPSTNSVIVKKMNGRWTKADNPLANILNIAETEIVQGNDNWAKQALLNFVRNAGDNTLLTEVEPWFEKNPATGKWSLAEPLANESLEDFEARMQSLRALDTPLAKKGRRGLKLDSIMSNKMHRNEHLIRLKVAGLDKAIWVNGNPALAKAVTGIGKHQSYQWLRRASRTLSNLFTTYSLDFAGKNFFRDTIYSRVALLVKEKGEEGRKYRKKFRENWWKNFGYGAFAYPMIKLAAEWDSGKLQTKQNLTDREQMFIDFMHDGGQTGYTVINSVKKLKKELETAMRSAGEYKKGIPIFREYANAIKTLNEGFELLTRFTAYQTSRDMGRSGQRAAHDAKEISVNFNRRGAQSGEGFWGNVASYLGASHYFYNAGVQGFDNFLRLFKTAPVGMGITSGALIVMGIATPFINSMLAGLASGSGDGGDDDWYWNLPEWVRRNNIILGTGRWYLAVPLPVEFRALYGIGDITGAAFAYDKTPNRTFGGVAGDLVSTAMGILPVNPVEGYTGNGNLGDAALRAVAPDAGMFFVDWATNRDYTGRPLWKENPFSNTVPKSQGAYASTPKGIIAACQLLANVSAGAIDIPPGLVRDAMNNYGGGFFRAAEDASKILTGIFDDDPDRPFRYDNIPFFSGFTGHIDEDRLNTSAVGALRDYKELTENNVLKLNAILNTSDVTEKIAYEEPDALYEMATTTIQKARVKKILGSTDYKLGVEYRNGMNNTYKMKQRTRNSKNGAAGEWYKSNEVEQYGVNSLKKQWKDAREAWAKMPDKTPDEKSAKAEAFLEVQDKWHTYYDAEANLAEKLMDIEYGK